MTTEARVNAVEGMAGVERVQRMTIHARNGKLFFRLGLLLFGGFLRILVAHGWMVLSERKRVYAAGCAAMATVCHIHQQMQVTDF